MRASSTSPPVKYIQPAAVVIENARISHLYLTPSPALPPDAETLDLPGVTLVPGLGDMHASAFPSSEADADYHAALSLAYGVTMARNLDVGLPWGVAQRARARTGEILAPLLWTSGPALEERAGGSLSAREVFHAEGARREVRAQAAAKVDWITVGGNTRAEVYQAIIAAAHLARLRVGGHAVATSMAQLARLGIDAIDHLQCPARTREEYPQLLAAPPNGATDRPLFESILESSARDRRADHHRPAGARQDGSGADARWHPRGSPGGRRAEGSRRCRSSRPPGATGSRPPSRMPGQRARGTRPGRRAPAS